VNRFGKTCTELEKSGRENILPMIVAGSWIESMHILVRNTVGSTPGSKIYFELYQQRIHLENLILYLKDATNEIEGPVSKTEMTNLIARLDTILQKYQQIDVSNPGHFSLGHFKDVIFQVESLRNSMLE
jgi:hypothetical protein